MQITDEMLAVLNESRELSFDEEIKDAEALIRKTAKLNDAERDTLVALFARGPLHDGDVPSKSGRDGLIDAGFAVKVVVNGLDGFNACTYDGRGAYRLIQSGLLIGLS